MSTKTPSSVLAASPDATEHVAYAAVAGLPAADPHDLDRLGYCVWLWLSNRRDTLAQAVRNSGARLQVEEAEAVRRITESLKASGIAV